MFAACVRALAGKGHLALPLRPHGTAALYRPYTKKTTGIVGLPVVTNAREVLLSCYQRTLDMLEPLPEKYGYRISVDKLTRHRMSVLEKFSVDAEAEKELGLQLEEAIEHAEDEMFLIGMVAKEKPWINAEGVDPFRDGRPLDEVPSAKVNMLWGGVVVESEAELLRLAEEHERLKEEREQPEIDRWREDLAKRGVEE
eukprot:CAMPEP_0177663812 /NCGR_PEP_ID=MMETSP0447-20121125/20128_1 /TAXON_ID=0 /ORGANISM="Stygamoeba regulata, Strain BSH-02190019" /LENGTH=197 /DNA_ID=CAMNT_0019169679 /DNA_START=52 /DNA_END=645 /DNA_ORIENTATION=+